MDYKLVLFVLFAFILGIVIGTFTKKSAVSNGSNHTIGFYKSAAFYVATATALGSLCIALILENVILDSDTSFLTKTSVWAAVAKEFFFASVIALFVIITIESFSKNEQSHYVKNLTDNQAKYVKEILDDQKSGTDKLLESQHDLLATAIEDIRKNVLVSVYKNRLDEGIFTEVEEHIFKKPFIREKHERSMKLCSIDGSDEHLKLIATQRYIVKNTSDTSQASRQKIYIPKSLNPYAEISQVDYLDVSVLSGEVNVPDAYQAFSKNTDNRDAVSALRKLEPEGEEYCYEFPEISVGPFARFQVELRLTLAKDESDNEILTFLSPTLQGHFEIESEIEGLVMGAINLHRGRLMEGVANSERRKSWTFSKPMLPYQGYVVYWSPRGS